MKERYYLQFSGALSHLRTTWVEYDDVEKTVMTLYPIKPLGLVADVTMSYDEFMQKLKDAEK